MENNGEDIGIAALFVLALTAVVGISWVVSDWAERQRVLCAEKDRVAIEACKRAAPKDPDCHIPQYAWRRYYDFATR
jgi:hypothetical protein